MYRAICYLLVGVFWNLALFLHSNALSAQPSGIVLSFCWLDWVLSFECGQPLWSVLWMGSHRWKLVLISPSLNLPQKQEIPCLMCEFCLFFFFLECHKNLLSISCDISDSLSFFLSPDFKSKIIPPSKCSHPINLSSFKTTKERLFVFLKIYLEVY